MLLARLIERQLSEINAAEQAPVADKAPSRESSSATPPWMGSLVKE